MERDEVLTRLRERIVAFAASRGAGEAAEDLVQDVLTLLHDKYRQVTDLGELLPLSFQILRYKMLDYHRKRARRGEDDPVPAEDCPLADPGPDPALELERKQTLERLLAAIDRLGPRCRELFRLKLEGRTFSEIQRIMGQHSINTIYTWDFRCRRELLDRLSGSWESPRDDATTGRTPGRERG